MMKPRLLALALTALPLLAWLGIAAEPKWPKVNVALAYVVDPAWPQRPEGMQWAEVSGIAVDRHDQVYVFTRTQPPIQVFDSTGKFLRSWGQEAVKSAHHIKVDPEGNVWTTDIELHVVRKFTPHGKLLMTLGTDGVAGRDAAHFNMPTDVAITQAGDIFVADGYGNARIVRFDQQGKYVKEWGELGSRPGQLSIPHAIAADSKGRVFVADRNNVRIQVFDTDGRLLDVWNNLVVPWGFCLTKEEDLWVCGCSPMPWRADDTALSCPPKDQVFMRFNGDGKLLQLWTCPKGIDGLERPGDLNWVHCLAVDSQGNLYAGDIKGKRAQKFKLVRPEAVSQRGG